MITRRALLALLLARPPASGVRAGRSPRAASSRSRAASRPAARSWRVSPTSRQQAGLTAPIIYGGVDSKSYIIEVVGCGVAFLDYDNDGWLDLFVLSGTRLEGAPAGDDQSALQEQPRRHVHRRHREGRPDRTGWASAVTVGDYDNDGFDDLFITYYGHNVLYHNNGDGTFTDVDREGRPAADGRPLRLRVHVGRLRPRRPPGSVRRHLSEHHARQAAEAGRERRLPLEGRAGELRAARPAARIRPAVPQQRRRHVHRREPAVGRRGGGGSLSDDRGGRRLRQRRLARHLRRVRLDARAGCSATSTTARSARRRSNAASR